MIVWSYSSGMKIKIHEWPCTPKVLLFPISTQKKQDFQHLNLMICMKNHMMSPYSSIIQILCQREKICQFFDHGKGVQIGNQEHQCGGSIQTFPQRAALESPVLRALTLAVPSQLEFSLPRFPTHASAWNDQPSVSGAEFSRVKEVTP